MRLVLIGIALLLISVWLPLYVGRMSGRQSRGFAESSPVDLLNRGGSNQIARKGKTQFR
jgi:hypothetical protein